MVNLRPDLLAIVVVVFISGCVGQAAGGGNVTRETAETGGTLAEWKDTILEATGPDSEETEAVGACDAAMIRTAAGCSVHQGWFVANAMEIADLSANKSYTFQDVAQGGCPRVSPEGTEYPITVETETIDHQSGGGSEYQVVCNVLCSWWTCEEKVQPACAGSDYAGTSWSGTFEITTDEGNVRYTAPFDFKFGPVNFTDYGGCIVPIESATVNDPARHWVIDPNAVDPPAASQLSCYQDECSVFNLIMGLPGGPGVAEISGSQALRMDSSTGIGTTEISGGAGAGVYGGGCCWPGSFKANRVG